MAIEQAMQIARADILQAQLLATTPETLEETIAEVRAVAKASFSVLVELTFERSFSVALSHVNVGNMTITESRERAGDVVQEAYLRAYKHLPKFKGGSQFETWMYRIIKNCAHSHYDKEKRHHHAELDAHFGGYALYLGAEPDPLPDTVVAQNDTKQIVWSVLGELGLKDREVIVLRDFDDMSYEEIAEMVGSKPIAVKVRRHRALKKMKALLLERELAHAGKWS